MKPTQGQPLRIAFDARMVHHSGIGTYIREMAAAMRRCQAQGAGQAEFRFLGDPRALEAYDFFRLGGKIEPFRAPIYGLREQLFFPAGGERTDAFHFPHYNVPLRLERPFFVTIHDLIHLLFPEFVKGPLKRRLGRAILFRAARKALAIFTVSAWSKRDIVERLGAPHEKVIVTPNAAGPGWRAADSEQVDSLRRQLGLGGRYLLAVGVNKPHKNFPFLIDAFLEWSRRRKEDVQLALCGMQPGDAAALGRYAAEKGDDACADTRRRRVVFVPYLEHGRLPALYQGAEALVFPSLYEGFGLPILEAQRLGVPVIASNASCIPEVAGEGALLFDPRSRGELMSCLDAFFGNDRLRRELSAKGHENESRYSWDKSARRTLEAYGEKLGRSPYTVAGKDYVSDRE